MRLLRQIALLVQKDLLVIWRSKKWFIAEIIAGLFFLPLILVIVNKSNNDDNTDVGFTFDAVPITGGKSDLRQQVKNIQRIYAGWCTVSQTLAYTGYNADELMAMVSQRFAENNSTSLHVRYFPSVEQMKRTLNDDLNLTAGNMCGAFLGGVVFETVDADAERLSYRIMFPRRVQKKWYLDQFWPEDGPYSAIADFNNIPGEPNYWSSGFLSIQFAIESSFLQIIHKPIDFPVFLQRMPPPLYRSSAVIAFLKQTPTLWSILVIFTLVHTVKNIVDEKAVGVKTYMMVMGLDSVAFYSSHMINGLLKVSLNLVVCAGVFATGLEYVSGTIFLCASLLFGICAILFAVLFSTMARRPAVAIAAAVTCWILLMVVDNNLTVTLTDMSRCFLGSLNPYTAFKLGVKSMIMAETTNTYLGWSNFFTKSTQSFTLGLSMIMMIVDVLWMALLALYLDAVWPTDDSPRRPMLFMFQHGARVASNFNVNTDEVDGPCENMETDSAMNLDEADIDVRKMSKIWEGTGQMAVDNLSFRAYRGQVTVLLGHNGAGKSTTFSVISGSTGVTAGSIYICKEDIQTNLYECQRQIGFCPQYNPLFDRLTVREHLRLYARLKSDAPLSSINAEIEEISRQVQLKNKLNELAESLSGGMKRKLCVAMALIGDSRVILLDEPTAGMDPEARHDVRILLEKAKRNRTILLTTHYMDEADLLGDRIGIMVKGRMVCNGSPEFLKNKFGTGYVLSVVLESDTEHRLPYQTIMNNILRVTRKHAPDARLEGCSLPEFSVILPVNQKIYFADLFQELEEHKDELRITSFGLSFNTLEQVFLRVGEVTDNDHTIPVDVCDTAILFSSQGEEKGAMLIAQQMLAMIQRHFLNVFRNKMRTLAPLVISLLLFALFVGFARYNGAFHNETRDLSLTALEPVSIPIAMWQSATARVGFPFIVGHIEQANHISLSSLSNLSESLLQNSYNSLPLGIGAVLFGNNTVLSLFNGAAYHSPPSALLLISNALINKAPDSVRLSVEIYDVPNSDGSPIFESSDSNLVVAIIVILAFSLLSSNFAMPLVEDNQSKFKHQMLLTKLHTLTYWVSVVLWNLIIYTLFCALLALLFLAFGWMKGCMSANFLLWGLYFWCCVPFVYCSSFIFKSSVKAYAALISWNVVISMIALITDVMLEALQSNLREAFRYIAFVLLPAFSLGNGMVTIAIHSNVPSLPPGVLADALSTVVRCMIISGCLFWTLLLFMESKTISLFFHRVQCRMHKRSYHMVDDNEIDVNEDADVSRERDFVRSQSDNSLALAVRNVSKSYGDLCAVRNLTFGVRQSDCFGLLGVNGAGKTTTFSMLTGELYPNTGYAAIGGVDVIKEPVIGYCPQFDALPGDLTGREVLTILGSLNGICGVDRRVHSVLESIHMTSQADKLIQYYSGGQKRRFSIGITLMSKTHLIMLDEPTAGIDPATRRKIWQLLTAIKKQNVAMLLTSHSMEECEALCNRIGFMNKGSLISIGSSQHLKSRFGNSYLLTFTLANPGPAAARILDGVVTGEFNASSTSDPPTISTLHWEVPRTPDMSWSKMFRKAQDIAERYPHTAHLPLGSDTPLIRDFSLTQNSLEQVFLRLAEVSHEEAQSQPQPQTNSTWGPRLNFS